MLLRAALQQRRQLVVDGVEALGEVLHEVDAAAAHGGGDAARFFQVAGHRFFQQHMHPGGGGGFYQRCVLRRFGRDAHGVALAQHGLQVVEVGGAILLRGFRATQAVVVPNAGEQRAVAFADGGSPKVGMVVGKAEDTEAEGFSHDFSSWVSSSWRVTWVWLTASHLPLPAAR